MDKKDINVSVRNLVEFILRSGSIDSKFTGSSRAVQGTKIHKMIQNKSVEDYTPEVMLKTSMEFDDFILNIEGRADGIVKDGDNFIIDEIKTTTAPLSLIDENFNPQHIAQAKCYAYMFSEREKLDGIGVRLTYYQLDTKETKYIENYFTWNELKEFFHGLAKEYFVWAKLDFDFKGIRDISIKKLQFPFEEYRAGQRKMAVAVYRTISNGKKLFAQAPTGIGKTISTLFPAIKAMGEGHTSKIFYLTAKNTTHAVAEDTLSLLRKNGLKLKSVTLTAKEKICPKEKPECNPDICEFAKGHFDRVNDALLDILSNEDDLKKDVILKYSNKHNVCPFEFSLDLTIWADCVICDYNYVFDPRVSLKRFFQETKGEYTFLIDEAHNLVDRARDMYSAEISKKAFFEFKKTIANKKEPIYNTLNKINKYMIFQRKKCDEHQNGYYVTHDEPKEVYTLLEKLSSQAEEILLKGTYGESEELLNLYFKTLSFLRIGELYDEKYVTFVQKIGDDVSIKLLCLDPSYLLGESLKKGKAAIFFSGTLLPMDYFRHTLGGCEEDYRIYLNSPFDVENRALLISDKISTKYVDRENSYSKIAEQINTVVNIKKGNYIVFFPSYSYMNEVYDELTNRYPDININMQSPSMTQNEREDFIGLFQSNPKKNTIGFCVLGGIYSEGIDLKADRLIGVIIIGVGLPMICPERDIIKAYFDEKNSMGFEYAYMYPGMNKVMQAAGRLIRTIDDKGIILLIDERFSYPSYRRLFPKEWFPNTRVDTNSLGEKAKNFWLKKE
jgi:Rad3-related DNA helicase